MWKSALVTAAFYALVKGDCQRYEDNYYAELGCKPGMVGDDGCPRSYDCSMIDKRDKTKCYYRGQGYNRGAELWDAARCLPLCECEESYPDGNSAFSCVTSECDDQVIFPSEPGCYFIFDHEECCSVGRVCSNDQTTKQNATSTVCQYKSRQYQLGTQFYPDEDPCLECICQTGFTGDLVEPYCKKINCNLELRYGLKIAQGCVPVYYGENSCCPSFNWRCPEELDFAYPGTATNYSRNMDPDLHCRFGDVVMKIGDKLSPSKSGPYMECTCRVPPHPVCIRKQ